MAQEQVHSQSIQARIAALNVGHVGRAPITATKRHDDIIDPARPALDRRSYSTQVQNTFSASNGIGNEPIGPRTNGVLPPPTIIRTGQTPQQPAKPTAPPRLPPRQFSSQPSPALPPRRPSEQQLMRRDSNESISSTFSNISSISALSNGTARTSASRTLSTDAGRTMAPAYDPAKLPPLPPKRTATQELGKARTPLKSAKSTSNVTTAEFSPPPVMPSLPPRRPARQESTVPEPPPRKLPPRDLPPVAARSALSFGMNKLEEPTTNGNHLRTPSPGPTLAGRAPPAIPLSSRPDISKLLATKPKVEASPSRVHVSSAPQPTQSATSCLSCRDFSGPDTHASKFPRESVPSLDWLATQLTTPFPSLTDKARAIFTWLHHNISYDVVAFFNDAVKPSTPSNTLATGLAVCEGYAALFTALATKVGLESVVVGGHGKGFGFAALQPGAPLPPESQGHAWNAVKIDNGEWKLIDCCWGAGNIGGPGQPYNKDFTPRFFTMPNDEFGLGHFPGNKAQFYRNDGRERISWEEYIVGDPGGEPLRIFSGVVEKEGLSETSFMPKHLKIPTSPSAHTGPTVRFQFSRVCPHWDPIRNGAGKPYVLILAIHGVDGREDDYVPFETNGSFWWADVEPRRLGCKGQTISAFTVETVSGNSGRGLDVDEYRQMKGRKAMSFGGVAAWELV
jgi:transglutaminase-like putative cysteine protease